MKIQIGVIYRSAGQRVQVEAGHKRIGMTSHDVTTGQQTYWFKSQEEFDRVKYDLFEMASPLAKPVPVVRVVESEEIAKGSRELTPEQQEVLCEYAVRKHAALKAELETPVVVKTPVAEDAQEVFVPVPEPTSPTEIPAPVTIPPPPPAAPSTLADDIFAALAGRKIRVKDFAAELGLSPETVEEAVSSDSRFAKIVAGWVRVAEATAPASE
jgi:hypothetical protein